MKTLIVMKSKLLKILFVGIVCAVPAFGQRGYEAPLTNSTVVNLVRAGFKEKTVIAIINNRPNRFSLEPDKLIELKRNGVSEKIILTMMATDQGFLLSDDDWSTDSMLGGKSKKESDGNKSGSEIFGGSQGSRSSSGGRGQSGGNNEDRTTTGSATVRILRSPSETGDTALKMEKTPTLTNESVIKLVEAGFSEGTIIKRIEESPAEFDLSAAKLLDLRRRRVTEPIISAMTSAMSDESESRTGSPARTKGN